MASAGPSGARTQSAPRGIATQAGEDDAPRRVRGRQRRALVRGAAALSQEALGSAADLHPTEISRLERAKREPRLITVVRLARALDVTAADLVKGVS